MFRFRHRRGNFFRTHQFAHRSCDERLVGRPMPVVVRRNCIDLVRGIKGPSGGGVSECSRLDGRGDRNIPGPVRGRLGVIRGGDGLASRRQRCPYRWIPTTCLRFLPHSGHAVLERNGPHHRWGRPICSPAWWPSVARIAATCGTGHWSGCSSTTQHGEASTSVGQIDAPSDALRNVVHGGWGGLLAAWYGVPKPLRAHHTPWQEVAQAEWHRGEELLVRRGLRGLATSVVQQARCMMAHTP